MGSLILGSFLHISIHALLAESDHNAARGVPVNTISIHALLAESDQAAGAVQFQIDIFLSTLSLRRATSDQSIASGQYLFLSTLSLRRATVSRRAEFRLLSPISIHALLAESDLIRPAPALPPQRISIHALLAESDGQHAANRHRLKISIHALLAESDPSYSYTYYRGYLFLSTLSLRRATFCAQLYVIRKQNFYPRSPCGERHTSGRKWRMQMEFLSTLSLRRATLQAPPPRRPQRHFYPRSPCGERQRTQAGSRHNTAISIHALLAESDQQSRGSYIRTEKFLSTLSLRRATIP